MSQPFNLITSETNVKEASKRVLFLNGFHIPVNIYAPRKKNIPDKRLIYICLDYKASQYQKRD